MLLGRLQATQQQMRPGASCASQRGLPTAMQKDLTHLNTSDARVGSSMSTSSGDCTTMGRRLQTASRVMRIVRSQRKENSAAGALRLRFSQHAPLAERAASCRLACMLSRCQTARVPANNSEHTRKNGLRLTL